MMVRESERNPIFFHILKKQKLNENFECCNANYNKFYNFSAVLILLKTLLKSLILKRKKLVVQGIAHVSSKDFIWQFKDLRQALENRELN